MCIHVACVGSRVKKTRPHTRNKHERNNKIGDYGGGKPAYINNMPVLDKEEQESNEQKEQFRTKCDLSSLFNYYKSQYQNYQKGNIKFTNLGNENIT